MYQVVKRDGKIASFDISKISTAITKAFEATHKEYNADFLQRSDAQSALNEARKLLSERYKNAQGAAAVSGATDESVAQQKAAANEALADITGSIAERADAYKEQVRANYENQMDAIDQARMDLNDQRAKNAATAASGLATASSSLGSTITK